MKMVDERRKEKRREKREGEKAGSGRSDVCRN